MSLDPISLRMFISACEEKSMARAAERECVAASVVSKRLAALESQLGVTLLERSRTGLTITPSGELLILQAREILDRMERAILDIQDFNLGVSGHVRVLASMSVLSEFLSDDVAGFLADRQSIKVSLEERVSNDIISGIQQGIADIGVCWDAVDTLGLATRPYRSDQICVAVPATHHLSKFTQIAYEDTLAYDQVEILAGSIVQSTLKQSAALAGKTVRNRVQVTTFQSACHNVAAGLGLAIVPREGAEIYSRLLGLKLIPLKDSWSRRQFMICAKDFSSLPGPSRKLADYLAAASKEQE